MHQPYQLSKVASEYDRLSVSNRETHQKFADLSGDLSASVERVIQKTASRIEKDEFSKEASFSNGLQLFADVRTMIANKLGISEEVAHGLTSSVITKSEKISGEYGADKTKVIEGIIEEMKGQAIENSSVFGGEMNMQLNGHNQREVGERIKLRLTAELGMNGREAEVYKTLIWRNAQDLSTVMRPHKREKIAEALTDLVIEKRDKTVLYDIKDSPMYRQLVLDMLEV